MSGTIRTYDETIREQIGREIQTTAQKIAESAKANAGHKNVRDNRQ